MRYSANISAGSLKLPESRSKGRAAVVEARKAPNRVIAIVQPVEAMRGKKRHERAELFSE